MHKGSSGFSERTRFALVGSLTDKVNAAKGFRKLVTWESIIIRYSAQSYVYCMYLACSSAILEHISKMCIFPEQSDIAIHGGGIGIMTVYLKDKHSGDDLALTCNEGDVCSINRRPMLWFVVLIIIIDLVGAKIFRRNDLWHD